MKKIKYNKDTGLYKLKLTKEELQLIARFICSTQLGSNDKYREAALSLLSALTNDVGDDFLDEAVRSINLDAVDEDDHDSSIIRNHIKDFYLTLRATEKQ